MCSWMHQPHLVPYDITWDTICASTHTLPSLIGLKCFYMTELTVLNKHSLTLPGVSTLDFSRTTICWTETWRQQEASKGTQLQTNPYQCSSLVTNLVVFLEAVRRFVRCLTGTQGADLVTVAFTSTFVRIVEVGIPSMLTVLLSLAHKHLMRLSRQGRVRAMLHTAHIVFQPSTETSPSHRL